MINLTKEFNKVDQKLSCESSVFFVEELTKRGMCLSRDGKQRKSFLQKVLEVSNEYNFFIFPNNDANEVLFLKDKPSFTEVAEVARMLSI